MNEWLTDNLTAEQQRRPRPSQTSFFAAYLKRVYGGQHFLMALLETGIVWTPSLEQVQTHRPGAAEHVSKRFCAWLQAVLEAIRKHKNDAETRSAWAYMEEVADRSD